MDIEFLSNETITINVLIAVLQNLPKLMAARRVVLSLEVLPPEMQSESHVSNTSNCSKGTGETYHQLPLQQISGVDW